MANADHDSARESETGIDNQAGASADQALPRAPDDRVSEILCRLTALEMALQQLKISVDALAGSVGTVPGTLMSAVWDINMLSNSMAYLTNLSNMHSMATGNLTAAAGTLLNQSTLIYADTQALRGSPPSAHIESTSFLSAAAPFVEESSQPGETGFI